MSRSRLSDSWIPIALCLVGLAFFFQPELASGFRSMQWDHGDTRFVNFLLEHGYHWLTGSFTGARISLWDPSFFHPAENVLAFSESMVGTLPVYALWRLLSLAPDSAMQAWMISMTILNFAAMLTLLRGPLHFGALAASSGAFLFAFGFPRAIQLGHPQLLQQFPMVFAIHALWGFFSERSAARRLRSCAAFFSWTVLLLYSSFYLGWFLVFGVAVTGLFALAGKERRALLSPLREDGPRILAAAAAAALCLLPLVLHYLAAARIVGLRPFQATYQPRLLSWLYLGQESPLYRWQDLIKSFRVLGTFGPEQKIGIGFVTMALAFFGWVTLRKRWKPGGARLIGLTAITLFFLATEFLPGIRVWWVVYEVVPGAKALRALPRVVFVLLIPMAIGVAAFFDRKFKVPAFAFGLLSLLILEQAHRGESFDKAAAAAEVQALQSRVGTSCASFFYSPRGARAPSFKYQLDAMWASLASGVPTVNGYSGSAPLGWDLWENRILDESDRARLEHALREWARSKNLDFNSICQID